jgi:hypothetical protein
MAYLESLACNIVSRMLSRTVTDLWRSNDASLSRLELDARLDEEVREKVGRALQSTVDDLRHAILHELDIIAHHSTMIQVDEKGLHLTPPAPPGEEPVIRAIADKKEIHRVLVKLSAVSAARRAALRKVA